MFSASGMNASGIEEAALRVLPAHERLDADRRGRSPASALGWKCRTISSSSIAAPQVGDQLEVLARVAVDAVVGRRRVPGVRRAWRRTSRRRRAGAASRGRRRARGRARCRRWPRPRRRSPRARAARRSPRARGSLASIAASGPSTSVISTANSSPPSRATESPARSVSVRRAPTVHSSRSPLWWPSVSLISLKRSRSIISTASCASRAASLIALVDAVVEEHAVRQFGDVDRAARRTRSRRRARAHAATSHGPAGEHDVEHGEHGEHDPHHDRVVEPRTGNLRRL